MTCRHRNTTCGPDRCFTGPVARDENRAAHGNITYTVTCDDCGAQRDVNQNQGFYERGPWGPSAAEIERREAEERKAELWRREARRAALDREIEERRDAVGTLGLTSQDGRRATALVDAEGYILIQGAAWEAVASAVIPTPWFDRAKGLRQAILEREALS